MSDNSTTLTLDQRNFRKEILNHPGVALVDFWAPWCGPCRAMGPVVAKLAKDFGGRAKIGKVNVDGNEALAAAYEIRAIPTLLFLKDGEVVGRFVGAVAGEALTGTLDRLLGRAGGAACAAL